MRRWSSGTLAAALCIFLAGNSSCNLRSEQPSASKILPDTAHTKRDTLPAAAKKPLAFDTLRTEFSMFLAGIKSPAGNYLDTLEENPEWKRYSHLFDSSWTNIEQNRLFPMQHWKAQELAEANNTAYDVFYPFSGPDFLHVHTFFPHGKTYTFIGLEPPGDVPDLRTFDNKNLSSYLASVYNSLDDLFLRSYFITREMLKDMHGNEINGALPIIYVFMARTNCRIVSTRKIAVNTAGEIIDYNPLTMSKDSVLRKNLGVSVSFIAPGSDSAATVNYFAVNLADDHLNYNTGFLRFLDNMDTVVTYVKSASYLMHYLTFTTIRNSVLKHSSWILQDDSGIAFRFFNKKGWEITLYGTYTSPITIFRSQYERDLFEAYQKDTTIKPLPFTIGYTWNKNGGNLLLAKKRNTPNP